MAYDINAMRKGDHARIFAQQHAFLDKGVVSIERVISATEEEQGDPLKLLIVNRDTPSKGIMPVAFRNGPGGWPLVLIKITPEEREQLGKTLTLPNNWMVWTKLA